ncbi:tail completion protein gp17 [Enterovirga rhinocerotis]|uniref:Uncharacterized protein DUF3168 n=1 Tax=Enterovirga rhinocerotis TaxID=1339210 RepID=A0A4R7C7Q1_9HYPH|nr:DUF3168 domain-containing protein [Enterovirga rhinocerotis]TDR94203.1 uncharacterized protein DUF3168 [Enterovirga rhinocerotis]
MPMVAAILALRDAVKATALADVSLAAEIGPRFFDRPPDAKDKPTFPYVFVGPKKIDRHELCDDPARPARMRLYVATRDFQSDEAWTLAQLLADALDGASPDLAAPWGLTEIRVVTAGDAAEAGQPRQVFLDITTVIFRAG